MSAELPRLIAKEDDRFGPFITALRAALDEIGCEGIAKTNSPTWGTRMEAILLRHILQFIPHVPVQCVSQPTAPTVIPSTASPVQGETLTPRTNARVYVADTIDTAERIESVTADFARTLERELAEAKEWVEYYKLNAASWRNSYDDRRAREEKAFADLQSAQSSLALAQARAGEAERERDEVAGLLKRADAMLSSCQFDGNGKPYEGIVGLRADIAACDVRIPFAALRSQAEQSASPAPSAQPASEDWMRACVEELVRRISPWQPHDQSYESVIERTAAILRRHQPAPQVGDGKTKEDGK